MEQLRFPHPQSSPDLPTTHGGFLPTFPPLQTAPLSLDFRFLSPQRAPVQERSTATHRPQLLRPTDPLTKRSLNMILQSGHSA